MSDSNNILISSDSCQEAVVKLRAVTRRIESFFDLQTKKLNEASAALKQLSLENEAVIRLSTDLEQQKQQLENDKELESLRLIEAGEKLASAWQELEDMQRQGKSPDSNQERKEPAQQSANVHQHMQLRTEPAVVLESRETASVDDGTQQPPAPVSSETTLFEMKLLQQQVAEHARRTR